MATREGPRRYAILQRYASTHYGPWEMGTTVELEPNEADWVNRDSPGTLAEVEQGVKLETGQPVPPEKLKGYRKPTDEPDEQKPASAATKDKPAERENAAGASQPRSRGGRPRET